MSTLTFDFAIQVQRDGRGGRKQLKPATAAKAATSTPEGRVPRLTKVMALALRFDRLIREGHVRDYAELARLGHVTRARMTQIMNLLNLAPDIQLAILDLPRVTTGRAPIIEHDVRPIATILDWRKQRRLWRELVGPA